MRYLMLVIVIIISQVHCFQDNVAITKKQYNKFRLSMGSKNKKILSNSSEGYSACIIPSRPVLLVDEKLIEKEEIKTNEELLYDEFKYEKKSNSVALLDLTSMTALNTKYIILNPGFITKTLTLIGIILVSLSII